MTYLTSYTPPVEKMTTSSQNAIGVIVCLALIGIVVGFTIWKKHKR